MIKRRLEDKIKTLLGSTPSVVLMGSRQVGKTTLALYTAEHFPSVYLTMTYWVIRL